MDIKENTHYTLEEVILPRHISANPWGTSPEQYSKPGTLLGFFFSPTLLAVPFLSVGTRCVCTHVCAHVC